MDGKTAASLHAHREPLVRMVKRSETSSPKAWLVRACGMLGALLAGAVLIGGLGHNPFAVYADMVKGAFGTGMAIKETVRLSVPLVITGLGIGIAFKMHFWNIGGEGQIIAGAVAATYFALFQNKNIPAPLLVPVMFLAAVLAGGLWGLIPAVFKAKWGTNETLFTLMLNYIALEVLLYFQFGPWRDPAQGGFPKISTFVPIARLPKVLGVNVGWIIALVLVAAVYLYINQSKQGFEITVVGESELTAHYAGMDVGKIIMRTMFLSGALCGLTGFVAVAGSDYTLAESVTGGVGFTAITVAWLSKLNPVVMILISIFLAMLQRGSNSIQTIYKIPASVSEILTGLILFFMLACEFFLQYRLVFRGGKGGRQA